MEIEMDVIDPQRLHAVEKKILLFEDVSHDK